MAKYTLMKQIGQADFNSVDEALAWATEPRNKQPDRHVPLELKNSDGLLVLGWSTQGVDD